jgi:hypothetical protein
MTKGGNYFSMGKIIFSVLFFISLLCQAQYFSKAPYCVHISEIVVVVVGQDFSFQQ